MPNNNGGLLREHANVYYVIRFGDYYTGEHGIRGRIAELATIKGNGSYTYENGYVLGDPRETAVYLFTDLNVSVLVNSLNVYNHHVDDSFVNFPFSILPDLCDALIDNHYFDDKVREAGPDIYFALDPDWKDDSDSSAPRVQIAQGQSDITRHESYFKKELAPNYEDKSSEHEYVDLGLPSGTLWAKMNVGATSETDYGLYFAWGETEGYADVSTKAFSWNDYKYGTSSSNITKYTAPNNKMVLDLEDDAAYVNWGPEWRMPTEEQCNELFNTTYVTNAWVTDYNGSGVNGRLFTSVSNGNTMFVPAADTCQDGSVPVVGNYGGVWASSRNSRLISAAYYFKFTSNGASVSDDHYRYSGQSVRGVVNK